MPPCLWKTAVVKSSHFCFWVKFSSPHLQQISFSPCHGWHTDKTNKQPNIKVSMMNIFRHFSLSSQAWWSTVMRSCPFVCSRPPGTTNEVMLQFGCINVNSSRLKSLKCLNENLAQIFKLRCFFCSKTAIPTPKMMLHLWRGAPLVWMCYYTCRLSNADNNKSYLIHTFMLIMFILKIISTVFFNVTKLVIF